MLRGPIGLVFAVIALTIAVLFGVFRYKLMESLLPIELIALFDRAAAAQGDGADAAEEIPEKTFSFAGGGAGGHLIDTVEGLRADGQIAAMRGNLPTFIDDVITGYKTSVEGESPSEITTIRPISGCRLTAPKEGTEIGHVTARRSGLVLPLLTYNDADLAAGVQTFVDAYRAGGSAQAADAGAPFYQAYDVAVTETRAPVYLVLESFGGNRIWNIHLAPGAQIERVVLLGGNHVGVANLDPVVPVEVLPDDALAACGVSPTYRLNPGHQLFQSVKAGEIGQDEADAKLAEIDAAVAAYDIWFRDSFGVLAQESRAGFDQGTISVVGPVPGQTGAKAVYVPVQGAKIRMTQDSYFEIRGQVPEGEDFASRVRAIATTFAFGNLQYLRQGVQF